MRSKTPKIKTIERIAKLKNEELHSSTNLLSIIIKNILLGMKFKPCGQKSLFKFIDNDQDHEKLINSINVTSNISKTSEIMNSKQSIIVNLSNI